MSLRKPPSINRDLLDCHKNKIIEALKLEHRPVVLYGDEAASFVREYTDEKLSRRVGGYFLHKNLPQEYIKAGVVCILNGKIGTLAHELRHAKQYQDNNKWLQRGKGLNFFYKIAYGFYPTEVGAFGYALSYLITSRLYALAFRYSVKILSVIFFENLIFWPIYIFYYLKYLCIMFRGIFNL